MPTNHIHLIIHFIEDLKNLAMIQTRIDKAREKAPNNATVQRALDHHQIEVDLKRTHIHTQMFEISRNN